MNSMNPSYFSEFGSDIQPNTGCFSALSLDWFVLMIRTCEMPPSQDRAKLPVTLSQQNIVTEPCRADIFLANPPFHFSGNVIHLDGLPLSSASRAALPMLESFPSFLRRSGSAICATSIARASFPSFNSSSRVIFWNILRKYTNLIYSSN